MVFSIKQMGSKKSFFWEDLEPEKLWYLVGVITSDGCLSGDKRHIDITSKDILWLEDIKGATGISNKISTKTNGHGSRCAHIQIGSVSFYDFLLSVGLFVNKSLTLGKMNVPREHFSHFLRGVIDGDGCIRSWVHPTNGNEQWSVRIYSGSEIFLTWLRDEILKIYGVTGNIYNDLPRSKSGILKFGKLAGRKILAHCYQKKGVALNRKKVLAYECIGSRNGWSKSKTIGL